jgi:hypothetical protein
MASAEVIARYAAEYAKLGFCVYPWKGSALVLAEEVDPKDGTTDPLEALEWFRASPGVAIVAFPRRSGLVEVLTVGFRLRRRSMSLADRVSTERTCWITEHSEGDDLDAPLLGITSHIFSAPEGRTLQDVRLAPGVYLNAGDDPIFLPPERDPHIAGSWMRLRWAKGAHPLRTPPAPLPDWLLECASGSFAEATQAS